METCYKMFRAQLLKSIPIRSNDFAMEPEITAKIAKRECRIFEVPISYLGRTYREGKKIGWKDGVKALPRDRSSTGSSTTSTPRTSTARTSCTASSGPSASTAGWPTRSRRYVGARVLEIGAGIGNITTWLLPRDLYVASDINPHYLHYLRNLVAGQALPRGGPHRPRGRQPASSPGRASSTPWSA